MLNSAAVLLNNFLTFGTVEIGFLLLLLSENAFYGDQSNVEFCSCLIEFCSCLT